MNADLCPACGQKLPGRSGRFCGICQQPIGKHHRWHTVGSTIMHKDCSDPELQKLVVSRQANLLEEPQP